jgi:DNA primase
MEDRYERYKDTFDKYLNTLYQYNRELQEIKLQDLSEFRRIPLEVIKDAGTCWVENNVLMVIPGYEDKLAEMGLISEMNRKPIYGQRWVIPIRDYDGKTVATVGYSNTATERYVYCTGKYYDRSGMFYGLEDLEICYKRGFCIVTEGITDAWALRGLGIRGVLANCGTNFNEHKIRILSRFKGVVFVKDRDYAGQKLAKEVNDKIETVFTVNPLVIYKDIDAQIREADEHKRKEYLDVFNSIIDFMGSIPKGVKEETTIM